jgi:ATP synthase protein I
MGRSQQSPEPSPSEGGKSPDTGGGYTALAYLIAGIGLYGGLGWLLDAWLGTKFLLPIGIILGAGLGIFLVIRRYGRMASGKDD